MAESSVKTYATQYPEIAVRGYVNVTRVCVPGHRKPFQDTFWRYVDVSTGADVGPHMKSRTEAFARLDTYVRDAGYVV